MSLEANPATDECAPRPTPQMLPAVDITIHVGPGVIVCRPKGGNARVHRSRSERAIRWRSDTPFRLAFTTFDDEERPEWPFVEAEPAWPVLEFTGTPKGEAAPLYYKYSISSAGGLFLDPIVIVDK
jgi:hypothetical protein